MSRVITGRVWGYADEVDGFMRSVRTLVRETKDRIPDTAMSCEVLDEKVIGQRGWFTKRVVTKVEYRIVVDNDKQGDIVANFLTKLSARMS